MNLISCKMLLQLFLIRTLTFPAFRFPCSNSVEMLLSSRSKYTLVCKYFVYKSKVSQWKHLFDCEFYMGLWDLYIIALWFFLHKIITLFEKCNLVSGLNLCFFFLCELLIKSSDNTFFLINIKCWSMLRWHFTSSLQNTSSNSIFSLQYFMRTLQIQICFWSNKKSPKHPPGRLFICSFWWMRIKHNTSFSESSCCEETFYWLN